MYSFLLESYRIASLALIKECWPGEMEAILERKSPELAVFLHVLSYPLHFHLFQDNAQRTPTQVLFFV